MKISFNADERQLKNILDNFQSKQLPFALALAATNLAKGVQAAERQATTTVFDNPTPFTQNAFAVLPATKSKPVARVFAKDVQAQYLAPFTDGGAHFLGTKKGLLVPKGVSVNQYGNLTRNKLKQLLAKPNVFVGPVTFKSGQTVNGVWQRPAVGTRRDGGRGTKGNTKNLAGGVRTGLKLLIRFEDALPVKEHFDFAGMAGAYVRKNAAAEFAKAYALAIASAK